MLIRVLVDTILEALLVRPIEGTYVSRTGFCIGMCSELADTVGRAEDSEAGNATFWGRLRPSKDSRPAIENLSFEEEYNVIYLLCRDRFHIQLRECGRSIPHALRSRRGSSEWTNLTNMRRQKNKETRQLTSCICSISESIWQGNSYQ